MKITKRVNGPSVKNSWFFLYECYFMPKLTHFKYGSRSDFDIEETKQIIHLLKR